MNKQSKLDMSTFHVALFLVVDWSLDIQPKVTFRFGRTHSMDILSLLSECPVSHFYMPIWVWVWVLSNDSWCIINGFCVLISVGSNLKIPNLEHPEQHDRISNFPNLVFVLLHKLNIEPQTPKSNSELCCYIDRKYLSLIKFAPKPNFELPNLPKKDRTPNFKYFSTQQ